MNFKYQDFGKYVCQMNVIPCQKNVNACQMNVIACQTNVNTCQMNVNVCQMNVKLCQMNVLSVLCIHGRWGGGGGSHGAKKLTLQVYRPRY